MIEDKVREIFGDAARVEGFLMEGQRGLQVTFNKSVDLADVVQEVPRVSYRAIRNKKRRTITIPKLNYVHEKLFDLVNSSGLVVLNNATFGTHSKARTSSESIADDQDVIIQDPFHRDWLGIVQDGYYFVMALFKDSGQVREAPTFYAMTDDVRNAVRQLRDDYDDLEVKEVLTRLLDPEFTFSIHPEENPLRELVKHYLPELTQDLFDRIPPSRRYAHTWRADEDTVVLHSNNVGNMLHGRPMQYCPSRTLKGATIGARM